MVLLARGSVTVTAVNDGVPEKLYRAWSNNANGSGYSTTDSSGKYLGTYVGLIEPTLASQYKWTLIKGETGEPGQPGVSAYLHTAWANSANGQTGFSTSVSTDKLYIGTYSSSSSDPSESYASYKWVRVKGLDAKFYSVIVDKSFLNRNGLSSTATEKIAINSYVYEGNSAGVAAPGFFIIKEQIKQTTAGATTYVFQEKHRSTTAVSQLNYTVSANAVTVKIEFYLTNQFNNLFAVRDIGVLMDASTDIEARVPIAQLIENINNHPSTTRISGAKLRFTNDVTFDKSFHTKLFAETGFIENLSAYEFSADNIKTGTLEADHIKGGTLDFDLFHAKHFSADNIISGTIDAGVVNIDNLSASRIKTGNLDVSSGLKITSGNHQIMSIDPETLNLEFNVNEMSIGGVKLISEDDQPQMEQNIATELESKIKPYLHIAYADNSTGTSGFSFDDSLNKLYMGTYTNYISTPSEDSSKYSWTLIKGDRGATGVGLKSITEWYLATPLKEGVTRTTSGWKDSVQTLSSVNNYLWNYEQVNYDNGTKHYTDPTIIGTFGEQGISVKGVTEYYLASPLSEGITKDTPGWTTDIQPLTPENKYLWNKEIVHYSDDAAFLDKTEILSGTEIFTDKADEEAVVHVEIDGKSFGVGNNNLISKGDIENWTNANTWNNDVLVIDTNSQGGVRIPHTVFDIGKDYTLGFKAKLISGTVNGIRGHASVFNSTAYQDGVLLGRWSNNVDTADVSLKTGVVSEFTISLNKTTTSDWLYIQPNRSAYGEPYKVELFDFQLNEGNILQQYEGLKPTPSHPVEIHSLNDFDVVSSVGKENLLLSDNFNKTNYSNYQWDFLNLNDNDNLPLHYSTIHHYYEQGEYTLSFEMKYSENYGPSTANIRLSRKTLSSPSFISIAYVGSDFNDKWKKVTYTFSLDEASLIGLQLYSRTNKDIFVRNLKLERGSTSTDWAPSSLDILELDSNPLIDKFNLLLDEPLRSVGDVKDRLFRDTDGLWKIERNVGKIIFDGTQRFSVRPNTNTEWSSYLHTDSDIAVKAEIITSHYPNQYDMKNYTTREGQQVSNYADTSASVIFTDYPMSTTEWKNKLINSPITLLYEKKEHLIETIGQELQDKLNNLRTFKDSNYIYTVQPDKNNILFENLKPTLHTTFKSKAWAGNFAGHPSIIGVYGDSAKLLYLSTSADSMTFNSDGSANPASQTITFTGNLQNVLGNVIFTAVAYNGTTVVSTISLSGVGNTRTLTQAQFPASADRIQVKATLGNLEDTVTIVKLKNGADAIVGYLTNESVTLSANNAGTVSSFVPASGTFKVFEGTIDRTSSAASTFKVKTQTGAVATINSSSGVYAVSSMSSDTANIVFEATYKNVKIDQTLSLSKSKEGIKGIPGPQGVSITKVDVQYYLSTSNDSLVGGVWSTTAPDWKDGRFMWSKTVTTYTSGSPTESKPVCITGAKGSTGGTGSTGATGRGVSSIVEQFYLSDSKTVEPPTSGWLASPPTWSPGKYIWTRSLITYTTGTPATSTTKPLVSSEWEAINELEIGGRNLLIGSNNLINIGSISGFTRTITADGELMITNTGTTGYFHDNGLIEMGRNLEDELVDGETYTFSIQAKSPNSSGDFRFYANTRGYRETKGVIGTSYSTQHITLQWISGNGFMVHFNHIAPIGSILYLKNPKLERGNVVTDYSPAPEDVTASIKAAQDKANAASQEAIAAQADATVGKNMADNLSNDSIITQVEKLELKREWDAIVKEKPSITIQATDYALQGSTEATAYNTAYNSLNGSIPTILSKMNETSPVNRTTFNTNFANYYDKRQLLLNRIAKKAKELADVAQSSVDNLEIGGRNLLLNSSFATGSLSKWSNNGSVTFANVDGRNTAYLNTSSGIYQSEIVKDNGLHTFSFMAKALDNTTSARVGFLNAGSGASIVFSLTNTWQRYEFTTTASITTSQIFHIYSSGKRYYITDIKLEKGNKATDWSPAPEDVEAAYTAVAEAKAEAERVKAEAYADGKVSDEEKARIADADAKLAAAKKHAEDQINISEGKATSWKKTYAVNQESPLKLTKLNGDALSPLNSYEVSAKVLGTGTVTSATSLFKAKESGGQTSNGWELVTIYTRGTNSNHPEFFIDSDGDPAIRLYNHTTKYTVEVTHTEYAGSQSSYTLSENVARAEAELARITAEAYADGKVTAEENARIADADAKLAAAKKHAEDQILADKTIKDTRATNQNPAWYYANYPKQTIREFKQISTMGLSVSGHTYGVLTTEVTWSSSSGGPVKQSFTILNTTYKRSGTTTSWTPWVNYDDIAETAKSDAATAKGIADGAASSALAANNLLTDIASDSVLTPGEKKNTKKEWDIIVGEKPKIDASADTYSITTQKTAYNNAYNTLNTYLTGSSGLLVNLNTKSAIAGATFRNNFKNYYNARQDLLNAISNGAKALVEGIEVGGVNLLKNSNFKNALAGWSVNGTVVPLTVDGRSVARITNTTVAGFYAYPTKLVSGSIYTISFDARSVSGTSVLRIGFLNESDNRHQNFNFNTIWKRYSYTIEAPIVNQTQYFHFYSPGSAIGTGAYITNIQLEKGNKPTDWTPAPEDLQAEIDSRPTFQDFDQTDKVTINGGNIKAGTISSKNNYSRINLDDGTFSFGNGRLVWNGSDMTVNGKISVTNITGDIPKSKLASGVQGEIDAGSAAKSTLDSKASTWDAKETPSGAQAKATAAETSAKKYIDDNTGNLVNNPAATGNHTGWTGSGLSSLNQTFEGVSTRVLQSSIGSDTQYYSSYFKVDPSKAYEVSAWFKKSVANSSGYYFGLNGINTSGSAVGFVHTTQTGGISNANNTNFYFVYGTAPTDWVKVVGYIMPVGTNASDLKNVGTSSNAIMKQNIDRIRVRFLNWSNGGTTRQLWVANPKVVEVDPNAIITAAQAKTLTDTWVHPGTTQINGNNIRTGTLDAKIITTGILSANSGTSTLNMSTGDMLMNGNFNLGSGALQWNKTSKTLSIKANSLKIGSYDAASKNDVSTSLQSAKDYTEQAVDGIEIGGTNLLKNSKTVTLSSNNHSIYPTSITQTEEGGRTFSRLRRTNLNSEPLIFSIYSTISIGNINSSIFENESTVVSFKARASQNVTMSMMQTTYGGSPIVTGNSGDINVTKEWKTFYSVFPKIPTSASGFRVNPLQTITGVNMSTFYLDLCEWKIEKGNKPTDWSPAPEDVQSQIDKSVKSTDVEYYLSTSNTGLAGGSWQTTAPAWANGKYMWSRTKVVLNDGSVSYNPSTTGTNITGAKGSTGAAGKGVSSITEEYYLSTSKTSRVGGSWTTTAPTWSTGKYMWTRSKIVWVNPTGTTYTDPIVDNSWEAVNEIEVGGVNIALEGWKRVSTSAYMVAEYFIDENFIPGQTYTVVLKGTKPSTQQLGLWQNTGSTHKGYFEEVEVNIWKLTFTSSTTTSGNERRIQIYQPNSATAGPATIEWFKVVKGNKTSNDWQENLSDSFSGGDNLLKNSNFYKTYTGSKFTVGGVSYNTYAEGWSGYNGGVSNATTNYHAHIDNTTFNFPVIEFNESNGNRGWKAINASNLQNNTVAFLKKNANYNFSVDVYATGSGTKLYGGFYYTKVGGTQKSFHAGQFWIGIDESNRWHRVNRNLFLPSDVDTSKDVAFYIYGFDFSSNSILYISNVKLAEGNKISAWSQSPDDSAIDVNKKTYNPVRYIRDWSNGSTANAGNHWYELMAFDEHGNNKALGRTVTTNGTASNLPHLTNGVTAIGTYVSATNTNNPVYVQVDLGSIHYNIVEVKVWKYYNDGRIYNDNKTEVSPDGVTWYPIYDYTVEGNYTPTQDGKSIPNTIAKTHSILTGEGTKNLIDGKADQSATSDIIKSMQDAIDIALQEKTAAGLQNELSAFIKAYNAKQEAEAKEKVASENRIKSLEGREVLTDTYYGSMSAVKTFIERTFYEGEEGLMIKNGKEGTHILINDKEISFFSDGTKTAYISQNKLSISDGTFIENLQIGNISASNETSKNHLTFRYTPPS